MRPHYRKSSVMKMSIFLATILLMVISSLAQEPVNGWKCEGDHCYTYVQGPKTASQSFAKMGCSYYRATLPMPKTQALETSIISAGPDNKVTWIWIGLEKGDDGKVFWADGEEFNASHTNWVSGFSEPRLCNALNVTRGRTSETWFSKDCSAPTDTVICEAPLFCTKPNTVLIDEECVRLETEPKTWEQAQAACVAEGPGVTLTSLRSQKVTRYILQKQTQPASTRAWLGATDRAEENTWVWTATGDVADIDQSWWGQGQPDNSNGNENCLLVRPDAKLNDANCNWKLPYYCSRRLRRLVPGS